MENQSAAGAARSRLIGQPPPAFLPPLEDGGLPVLNDEKRRGGPIMAETTTAAIRTEGLAKAYRDTPALSALDLEVAPASVRLSRPTRRQDHHHPAAARPDPGHGRPAEIFGVDCQADPVTAHRRVAFVPGDVSLWPR